MLCFRPLFGFLVVIAFQSSGEALAHPCKAQTAGKPIIGVVEKILRGGAFTLEGGNQRYRLSGTANPLILNPKTAIELHPTKITADRYGAIPAQGFRDGNWIQGEAVSSGKMLFYAFSESAACVTALREAEATARREKRGIWTSEDVELNAADLGKLLERKGQFSLIKGKVLSVGDRKRRLYLNFGQKWSQDFTISVVKQGAGAFKEDTEGALGRLLASTGKTVRIRGILEERQGPLIRLVDEAQIEILD